MNCKLVSLNIFFWMNNVLTFNFFNDIILERPKLPDTYKSTLSVFGFSMKYSSLSNKLIVSDPYANLKGKILPYGGVFECPLKGNNIVCSSKYNLVNENRVLNQFGVNYSPFFGYTLAIDNDNKLIICNPTCPYESVYRLWPSFCYKYDQNSGNVINSRGFISPVNGTMVGRNMKIYGQIFKVVDKNPTVSYIVGERHFIDTLYPENDKKFLNTLFASDNNGKVIKYLFVRYVISNDVFLNPIKNNSIQLIVPYSTHDDALGSYSVYNNDFEEIYWYKNTFGSMGQFYGYSGWYEDTNNDGFSDLILSAPFYSLNVLEGIVFYYKYDIETNKLSETALLLNGDNEINAMFGLSVIGIGDVNKDNFNDIVILAPYTTSSFSKIYVYLGSKDGLSSNYAQSFKVAGTDSSVTYNGFILLGKFDYNSDSTNDLALSVTHQNEVVLIRGIKYLEIVYRVSDERTIVADNSTNICTTNTECLKYIISTINVCYKLLYSSQNDFNFNPKINHNISTSLKEIMFKKGNKILDLYMDLMTLDKTKEYTCQNIDIVFKTTDNVYHKTFDLKIGASLISDNSNFCSGTCLRPDPLIATEQFIIVPKYCTIHKCQSSLSSTLEFQNKITLDGMATSSDHFVIKLTNSGQKNIYVEKITLIKDFYITITEVVPLDLDSSGKLVSITMNDEINDVNIPKKNIIIIYVYADMEINKEIKIKFIIFVDATNIDKGSPSIDIMSVDDHSISHNSDTIKVLYQLQTIFTVSHTNNSIPNKVNVIFSTYSNNQFNTTFTHYIEIINNGPSATTPLQIIFQFNNTYFINNLFYIANYHSNAQIKYLCDELLPDKKGNNFCSKIRFNVDTISRNSKVGINLVLGINNRALVLFLNHQNIGESYCQIYKKDGDIFVNLFNTTISTELSILIDSISTQSISFIMNILIPIIFAVFILTIIVILLYVFKIFDKLKFKKPIEEN